MPPHADLSYPGLNYPSKRYDGRITVDQWVEGKKLDDGAEGLWRIHDRLYDLKDFVKNHPGGSMWLELTKGTDITEAFEVHHLTPNAEKLLPKFYARDAIAPRYSPFTFHPNGFYKTIKRKAMKHFNGKAPQISRTSTTFLDFYFVAGFTMSILAARFESKALAIVAGMCFGFVINCGHNFVHMRDMWRNNYYYFTGFSVREWRISHCLSHHLYPNTIQDLEISMFEPIFEFLPHKHKSTFVRYGSWIYSPLLITALVFLQIGTRIVNNVFTKEHYLVFVNPALMLFFGNFQLYTLALWALILASTGITFGGIGFTAAHHDHEAFHEGDKAREDRDWGLLQYDAIHERKEIIGNVYLGLILYGEHTLHHLFPTIDHMYLLDLIPIYNETLKEFGIEPNEKPYASLIGHTFIQLARNEPNLNPRTQKKIHSE